MYRLGRSNWQLVVHLAYVPRVLKLLLKVISKPSLVRLLQCLSLSLLARQIGLYALDYNRQKRLVKLSVEKTTVSDCHLVLT